MNNTDPTLKSQTIQKMLQYLAKHLGHTPMFSNYYPHTKHEVKAWVYDEVGKIRGGISLEALRAVEYINLVVDTLPLQHVDLVVKP